MRGFALTSTGLLTALLAPALWAGTATQPPAQGNAAMQVTATREPLELMRTPAYVTVVTGDNLRARGATDLRTALAGVAGVDISPGGDSGPAGSVPAMWGLREFDAFLLVVDDVPWGGAFNPQLTTLDLHNVDRIEVLRGAAPVMYGATSFVGVIHVIHTAAAQAQSRLTVSGGGVSGNYGNASLALSQPLPELGSWAQSINANVDRERFADEKAGIERGHFLYRLQRDSGSSRTHIDLDTTLLRQDPTSPYPRVSRGLDPTIDTDANYHPADARIDENRFHIAIGHQRPTALGEWSTTLSLAHTKDDVVRGYLAEACGGGAIGGAINACGHTQEREISDLYFDTHLVTRLRDNLTGVWGIDELVGKGEQEARIFSYSVDRIHGNNALRSGALGTLEENELEDERNFMGVYGQLDWQPVSKVNVLLGLRYNNTHEKREGEEDLVTGPVPSTETRTDSELSGSAGIAWEAWSRGGSAVTVFADYRDTFKPAAIDFGPEAEADILDPESAHSTEVGVKTRWLDGRLSFEAAGFDMTMKNMVVPQLVNGSPGLANAGTLHLKGEEAELSWHPVDAATLYLAYAHHKLRFGDYVRLFDATPTQLRGRAQELSPDDSGSVGIMLEPRAGLLLWANYAYTGERFLNKRNTSRAAAFGVLDASVGYRFHNDWQVRLSGHNLTDSRDPVSESELGDGQYYRMAARSTELSVSVNLY